MISLIFDEPDMITLEKLKIYKKYNGDGDMWLKFMNPQNGIISGTEWALIDSLLQDIVIVKNGFASEKFVTALDEKLKKVFDHAETVKFFKSLSK